MVGSEKGKPGGPNLPAGYFISGERDALLTADVLEAPDLVLGKIKELRELDERDLAGQVVAATPEDPLLWAAITSPGFRDHAAAIFEAEKDRIGFQLRTQGRKNPGWADRARKFQFLLHKRFAAFTAAVARAGGDPAQPGRDSLRRLAAAVAEHQAASTTEGINPEPHDLHLWAVLSQITVVTDGETKPLTSLL